MIYFVRNVNRKVVKIGWTEASPRGRLKSLQTGSPDPLCLMGVMNGGRETEAALHFRFAEYHAIGEWFRDDPFVLREIRKLIDGHKAPIEPPAPPFSWGPHLEDIGFLVSEAVGIPVSVEEVDGFFGVIPQGDDNTPFPAQPWQLDPVSAAKVAVAAFRRWRSQGAGLEAKAS